MKYMLLIFSGDSTGEYERLSEEQQNAILGEYMAISQEGGAVGGEQLQPSDTATTVRVEDGRTLTTDGPYAETKDVLGGFYVFEVASLDEAAELAAGIPGAAAGAVELRAAHEEDSE